MDDESYRIYDTRATNCCELHRQVENQAEAKPV